MRKMCSDFTSRAPPTRAQQYSNQTRMVVACVNQQTYMNKLSSKIHGYIRIHARGITIMQMIVPGNMDAIP